MTRNLVVVLFVAAAVVMVIAGCAAPGPECCRLTEKDRQTLRTWSPAFVIVDPVASRYGVSPEFAAEQRAIDAGSR